MTAINPQAVRGPVTAVPVVAGTGVRFVEDVPNNRVVAEVDETVLYEAGSSATPSSNVVLSESASNFKSLRIYANWAFNGTANIPCFSEIFAPSQFSLFGFSPAKTDGQESSAIKIYVVSGTYTVSGTTITPVNIVRFQISGTAGSTAGLVSGSFTDTLKIIRVVGVNRIASN